MASPPEVPEVVRATAHSEIAGSDNVVVQITGDGNTVVAGYAHLTLTRYLNRRLAAEDIAGEAAILSPYSLAVPCVGRKAVLSDLWSWMKGIRPVSVRVMTAPAGTGKTRLALKLCDEALGAGWSAGIVTEGELVRFRAQQNLSTWGWNRPTLIAVDYASSRARLLRPWLIELADHPGRRGMPLRLLLLERHADPSGGWWRETFGVGGGDTEAVERLLDPELPYPLPALADPEERWAVLTSVLERIGSHVRPPEPGASPDFDRRLADLSWGGEPLFLLMAGLVAARAGFGEVLALSGPDLGIRIGRHELGRLASLAQARRLPERFFAHLAAYTTLCQGLSRAEAEDVVEEEAVALRYRLAGDAPEVYRALVAVLPGEQGAVAPVLPDLIGEAVILDALGDGSATKASAAVSRASKRAGDRVTASLIHLAQDYGEVDTRHVRVEPRRWLEQIVGQRGADLAWLVGLLGQLPPDSLYLREPAEAFTRQAVMLAREQGPRELLAMLLNNLSIRLSDLGSREEALAASEEAVALYRDLAAPHLGTFRPHLAMSLNSLSNRLSALARWEEALAASEEAVALYRDVAAFRPGTFQAELESSLNNLSNRLSDLGRREEALAASEEAVTVYRALAASRPDAFRPDLAASLQNLSNRLSDLGRWEESLAASEDAVAICRALAVSRPNIFRPQLAGLLNDLSSCMRNLGRREEALEAGEEAVAMYRALAASRPDAFRPRLAASLNNLSIFLGDLGRREEALEAGEEAMAVYRVLVASRPDVFRPELANSLNNLSIRLGHLGKREEALTAIEEAVEIRRALAALHPDAFQSALAESLNTLSNLLSNLGRREEALAAIEEAVAIRRALAASRPDAFQPDLAMSLNNLSNELSAGRRREEALAAIEEAMAVYRVLAASRPDAFRPGLAMSLNNLSACLSDLGRRDEALTASEEAVRIRRALAALRPDVFRPDLAISLGNLSGYLTDLGRGEEALAVCEEGVGLLAPYFSASPAAFQGWMATMVQVYVQAARNVDREPNMDLLRPFLPLLRT